MSRTLYPVLQAPVLIPGQQPETVMESKWHQPWSEPVRFKALPAVVVLLASTSGTVDPTPFPSPGAGYESQYHYPWSEPVRYKQDPKMQVTLARASGSTEGIYASQIEPGRTIAWFAPFSEPVKFKPSLKTALNPFLFDVRGPVTINPYVPGAFNALSEPVMVKRWLPTPSQTFEAYIGADPFPEPPNPAKWLLPLAEPVRKRPVGINAHLQPTAWFVKVEPQPLIGPRKPLYTQRTSSPGGGYPAVYWKGQTSG